MCYVVQERFQLWLAEVRIKGETCPFFLFSSFPLTHTRTFIIMNVLYELFCMGAPPSLTGQDLKKANFQPFMSKVL